MEIVIQSSITPPNLSHSRINQTMPAIPEKNKVDPKINPRSQEIRPHIVAKGRILAQDPNYPDSKILRQVARKLVAEQFNKLTLK